MTTVLITIPWFFPAYRAGGPIQSILNLVEQPLESIRYRIFCGNTDMDGTLLPGIDTGKWLTYNCRTEIWYAGAKDRARTLTRELAHIKPDLFFIIGIYDWHFNIVPLLLARKTRRIVSVRGMLQPGALSQKPLKKSLYLNLWKLLRLQKRVEFHASTDEEKRHVENRFGKAVKVHVAANFSRICKTQEVESKGEGQLNLVSIALISPMKNILLVLLALKKTTARIVYHIFGPVKDPAYWLQCQELIRVLPGNIMVCYHGDVPPLQVESALGKAHVFILPSKSENFGHAIYEALGAGKPVITSHRTPWNGLAGAKAGVNVSLDGEKELVQAINFFAAMSKSELQHWSRGAKTYAEGALDTGEIRRQYRLMFDLTLEETLLQKPSLG